MASTESPPAAQGPPLQIRSEEDARRIAQQHVAELRAMRRPVPAEVRTLRLRRLRRVGRRAMGEAERLVLATESLRNAILSPRYRFGRLLWRLRLTLRSWLNVPLFVALAAFTLVTLGRFGPLPLTPGEVGDAIGSALFGVTLLGAIAAAWNDIFRSPYQSRRLRRRIVKNPWCVLPTTSSLRWAELSARDQQTPVVPREDLYDEVLPGILDRRRSDVQMVVGEPGAGKTTALVGLAERLARMGIVPVVVPVWGEMPEDLVEASKRRFKRNAESLIGSGSQLDVLWLWLRAQQRVVVAIDDVDRVAPDEERGFMLRRALDELAGANLPAVVTTRPSGIPAGLAASAIDLGELEPAAAADHVLRVAGEESGALLDDQSAVDVKGRVRRWVREGRFTEVPFYLELLARLVAAGRCEELPPAGAVVSELGDIGRARRREDGQCEWNPLWVRFRLLDQFYEEIESGRVHRWLAIEDRERRSCLKALSEVALSTLAATAMRARRKAEEEVDGASCTGADGAGRRRTIRWRIEEFLEGDDRAGMDDRERRIVSAHEVIDTGERLRLLDRESSGELHFHHRIMQAYLAGRCLAGEPQSDPVRGRDWMKVEPPDWIGALLDRSHPERLTAQMALTFASLHACRDAPSRTPELAHKILDRCIGSAEGSLRSATTSDPNGSNSATRRDPRRPYRPEWERFDPDDAMAKLTTAAEIARAVNAKKNMPEILKAARRARGTTMWTKLHAIPSLAALGHDDRWFCMWDFARDPDQEVRRAASEAISDDAIVAYRALVTPIRGLLDRAALRSMRGRPLVPPSTLPSAQDRAGEDGAGDTGGPVAQYELEVWDAVGNAPRWDARDDVASLRALGWILPAMVNGLQEHVGNFVPEDPPDVDQGKEADQDQGEELCPAADSFTEAEGHLRLVRGARAALEQLVVLAFQGGNSELEASLAQGFKSDAMRHASDRRRGSGPGLIAYNRRFVTDFCIDDAEYWYARLVLHQALALYTIAGSDRRVAFDVYARLLRRGREPHPFVSRGARLARRAVRRHAIGSERWRSLLWDDEGVAVSRRPTELSPVAAQLVADVTLLLNLRELAPEDSQADFPHMRQLPYCLHGSRDRRQILGAGCPRSCGYGLCPLRQPPPDEPSGQRTISRAFCRGQYEIARHRKPRWQRRIRLPMLRDFWRQMERRART